MSSQATNFWDVSSTIASEILSTGDYSDISTEAPFVVTSRDPLEVSTTAQSIYGSSSQDGASIVNCTGYNNDLYWVKVGIIGAAAVCFIMLCCMSCILAFVYCAYYKFKDGEPSLVAKSKKAPLEDGFKRLTVNRETNVDQNRLQRQMRKIAPTTPQDSPSPVGPGVSTFSAHMAPPVPKSGVINAVGVSPAEETPLRKGALDRIEQEEAKRHIDMMLMNDKTLTKRIHDVVNRSSKSKSKSRSKPSSKNPSFVMDKSTQKLVRTGGKDINEPINQQGTKKAVNIPFKF